MARNLNCKRSYSINQFLFVQQNYCPQFKKMGTSSNCVQLNSIFIQLILYKSASDIIAEVGLWLLENLIENCKFALSAAKLNLAEEYCDCLANYGELTNVILLLADS
ncbi:hypothetical protein T4D_16294 [Trichinella pseudospiralis]|uniref:Uncharacterized protein n=1 Tax=Trichinella pseudospiralis TaxID=6337 RepID=A0A0V1FGC8_TRIPS|nr:hypothetical protein T4D_16294 [Trichinella pseudospiralis]